MSETRSTSTKQELEHTPRKLIGAIIATGTMAFIGILTETVMNVLFPELMKEFSIGTSTVQWITTGYLLVVSLTVPLSSYTKRKFTLKTQFVAGISLCILGALVAILSINFPMLLLARILQGFGTGIALPLMFNIILEQSPRSKIGQLMGVGNLVCACAPALGPTFGGIIGSFLSWRWVFVIVMPFLLIALVIGLKCIEQKTPTTEAHLNVIQLLCIVIGFVSLIFALQKGGAAITAIASGDSSAMGNMILAVVLLVVGVLALVVFGLLSRRAFSPLIRLGVLRSVSFRWHLFSYMLFPFVTIGLGFVMPNLLQLGLGCTPLIAGLSLLPAAFLGAIMAPLSGAVLDHIGPVKPILAGVIVAFAGVLLLSLLGTGTGIVVPCVFFAVYSIGFSIAFSNIMTDGLNEIPPQLKADGNALFSTLQQLAGAAGTSVMSVLVSVAQAGHGKVGSAEYAQATVDGSRYGFICATVVVAVSACAILRAFTYRRRHIARAAK